MKWDKGFSLIEIIVIIAILSILASTAIPVSHTVQHRPHGFEAAVMMKQILNAEIVYSLENDNYFPPNVGNTILIAHSDPPYKMEVNQRRNSLHMTIPLSHYSDFTIQYALISCIKSTSSPQKSLSFFKDSSTSITALLDDMEKIGTCDGLKAFLL